MSPSLTTFLFEIANFLTLAGVLGWLLFKPVREALAQQRAQLDAEASEAAQKLAEAERVRCDIEIQRRQLQEDLNRVRARELDVARQQAQQIVADSHAAVARQREMLSRQAAQMAENESIKLAQAAAAAAAAAVGQLLKHIDSPQLETALVRAACGQLRALTPGPLTPVKIESAAALSEESRAAVEEALGPAARGATYLVDPKLGTGLRIFTSSGLIDATASGLAQYAHGALVKHLNHHANNHPFRSETVDG